MANRTGVRRRAHIDLDVIRWTAASAASPLPDCAADLRADAHGHGLIPVARALSDAGVGGFVVSRVEDAAAMADAGLTAATAAAASTPARTARSLGAALFGLDADRPQPPALRLV